MALKFIFLFAMLTLVTGSTVANQEKFRKVENVSELSLTERLLTLFMAQKNPHYKNMPHEFKNISSLSPTPQAIYTWYDLGYLDFGTFVLLSRQWGLNFQMPEINWQYGVSYCYCYWGECWFCVDQAHSWTSKDSQFLGTETIQLKTDWTPKTFVQRYTIGNYTWWSPEGTTREEDFLNGGIITCKGFWAKLENVTFLFAGTYSHDETLGLQVDQLTLEFKAGNISAGQLGCKSKYHDSDEENESGAFHLNFAEVLEEYYEWYRTIFMYSLRTRLNCFLSEGKYVPPPEEEDEWWHDEKCGFEDDYLAHFVKSSALQMFQMMAAAGHQ